MLPIEGLFVLQEPAIIQKFKSIVNYVLHMGILVLFRTQRLIPIDCVL